MKKAFIYKIQNLENGKMYIGSTTSPRSRWNQHTSQLKKNNHHSTYLQNSWNKYGEHMFEFSIIDECEIEIQFTREREWVIKEKTHLAEWGYNMAIPEKDGGYTHTEHHKQIKREKSTINAARQWKKMRESGKSQIVVIDLETEEKVYYPAKIDCPIKFKNQNFNFAEKVFVTTIYNKTEEQIQQEFEEVKLRYKNYLKLQTPHPDGSYKERRKSTKSRGEFYPVQFKSEFETLNFKTSQEAADYFGITVAQISIAKTNGKYTKTVFCLTNETGIIDEAKDLKTLSKQNNHNYNAYKKVMSNQRTSYLGYTIHRNDTVFQVQRLS